MIETQEILLENQQLKEELQHIKIQFNHAESKALFLQYQLDQLKRQIFGVKSEHFLSLVNAGQLVLPMEEEYPSAKEEEQQTVLVEAHDRKKKKSKENHPVRKPFPAYLPREVEKIFPEGFNENSLEKPL